VSCASELLPPCHFAVAGGSNCTFVAMRHSTTRMLKWEEAALFISTQQLEITNTAPPGSLTSLARRGLNSISLAWNVIRDPITNVFQVVLEGIHFAEKLTVMFTWHKIGALDQF